MTRSTRVESSAALSHSITSSSCPYRLVGYSRQKFKCACPRLYPFDLISIISPPFTYRTTNNTLFQSDKHTNEEPQQRPAKEKSMSTITVPGSIPSVTEDCEQLRKAFSGWGTNEGLIISILAHRNAAQRKLIRQTYTETYGEDLLQSLQKELSNDFERIVLLWTLEPAERDAYLANEATKRWTASNQVILEIACTRSSHELLLVKQAYHARFKKSLEEDVAAHTNGDFRKLFVPLVSSYRYEGPEVNLRLAKSEAEILHSNISEKAYNHDEIIRILSTRSKAQLLATLNHYNDKFGNAITKDLKADLEDQFLATVRTAIKCLVAPEKYFEKVLRKAINKVGTDEWALTRVIATRAEVDMKQIKEEYYRRNSIPLDCSITKDTSGDYEAMLLALIGQENA